MSITKRYTHYVSPVFNLWLHTKPVCRWRKPVFRGGFLVAILYTLTILPVKAQQQQTLSLDSVLQRISTDNPMLRQYQYRAKAMDAYAEGAKSWMAPMVGAGVFMAPYPGAPVMEGGDKGSWMFSAEQSIPNPAKLKATEKYIKSRSAIETAGRDLTYNQLRAEAKTAYYNWVVLEKKQALLRDSERIMEYMLKLAKIRHPYSTGSLGSVYKAEGRLHEVHNMQEMVMTQIQQNRVQLNMLMNLPRDYQFSVDTTLTVLPPEHLQHAAVDTAYLSNTRSDIRQLDNTIASMKLGVEMEQLERKPDFSVRFEHMAPRNDMMPQQYSAMGMISIPIAPWSSKMYKANSKAMNLEIQAMQHEREAMLNEAQSMAAQMTLEINALHHHLDKYKTKILPALQKNYDVTMLAYEQNKAQLPEVIDAWEALNMAQEAYLTNLQQYFQMVVSYEKEIER